MKIHFVCYGLPFLFDLLNPRILYGVFIAPLMFKRFLLLEFTKK